MRAIICRIFICLLMIKLVSFSFAAEGNKRESAIITFLNTESIQTKETIVTSAIQSVIQESDNKSIKSELGEWIGCFIGVSGTNAPVVAAAIVNAAGTNYIDMVMASIAIASSVGGMSDKVCAEAFGALPEDLKKQGKAAVNSPAKYVDRNRRHTIMSIAKRMNLLLNRDMKDLKTMNSFINID